MRRYLLIPGWLALCVGPLFAQDVDLETEQTRQAGSTDQAAADASTTTYLPHPPEEIPDAEAEADYLGELYYQLQLLQQEVMDLRGQVEQQEHGLRQLKQQSLERYVDLDRRFSQAPKSGPEPGTTSASGNSRLVPEQAGEADAYQAAYSLVRSQQFSDAVLAFKQFLQDFPAGKYAPNAHYWLGELYLVITPEDLESSRREFILLIDQHPENSKIPDALYKLGKIYFKKGNREKSREYLDRVIREHAGGNSSAVKLAQDFISENF